jgi:hypothetical protein
MNWIIALLVLIAGELLLLFAVLAGIEEKLEKKGTEES